MSRLRDNYGAGPLHLLSSVAMGAIVLYALTQIAGDPQPLSFAIWFAGAVVAHDLLAFPLYSALGLIAGKATSKAPPNAINYIRVPAFLSAVSLVIFFPFILGLADYFPVKTGVSISGYFARWLLLTGALALGAALLFAINIRRGRDAGEPEDERDETADDRNEAAADGSGVAADAE